MLKINFYPKTSILFLVIFVVYSLIVFLNRIAIRKKVDEWKPIHKQATLFQNFESVVKSYIGDTGIIEEVTVKTDDGYLLKCHRVRLRDELMESLEDKRFVNKPVIAQHGFCNASETMFRICGKYLVEKGFDVWLPNVRGNRYSLYHEDENISYEKFYDFTLDDYAIDLKTHYKYVMEKTGCKKITLVGYSIGGMNFAMSHSDPDHKDFFKEHTDKVILVAPLLYAHLQKKEKGFNHTPESIEFFLKKSKDMGIHHWSMMCNFEDISFLELQWLMESMYKEWDLSGADVGQPNGEVDELWSRFVVPDLKVMIFPFLTLFGIKAKNIGGDGVSVKSFAHALSTFNSSVVRKFDRGKKENLSRYGSEIPPVYDYANIATKTYIIAGGLDQTCNTDAQKEFAKTLNTSNNSEICKVFELEKYKHSSFLGQKEPKKLNDILDQIIGL